MILSVAVFFLILLSLGFSIYHLLKLPRSDALFQDLLMILGLGLVSWVLLIYIFDLLSIPLDYKIFLALGIISSITIIYLKKSAFDMNYYQFGKKDLYIVIVLAILVLYLAFLIQGAYRYSYLEDDDPWEYAEAAKYVSVYKNFDPVPRFAHYLEPYPPAFSSLLGIVHETNDSIMDTLKIFNVILITLALAFLFLLLEFISSSKIVSISCMLIAAVSPAFMSHFIWSQSLAMCLYILFIFFLFYLEKHMKPNVFIITTLVLVSALLIQTIAVFKTGIMFIIFLIAFFYHYLRTLRHHKEDKETNKREDNSKLNLIFSNRPHLVVFFVGAIGLTGSILLYWLPAILRQGINEFLSIGQGFAFVKTSVSSTAFDAVYGNRAYSLGEFIIAPLNSSIDQATGIGLFTFTVLILSLLFLMIHIYKSSKPIYTFFLGLFIFEFISVMSGNFSFGLFSSRSWPYVIIAIVGIISIGLKDILQNLKNINTYLPYIFLIILIIGFYFTSFVPKKAVQQAEWPPGVSWSSADELSGYVSLQTLPKNTPIFSACLPQKTIIGFDMLSYPWNKEVRDYQSDYLNKSVEDDVAFLSKYSYQYLIMSSSCANKGLNITNAKLSSLLNSSHFKAVNGNKGYILLQLV